MYVSLTDIQNGEVVALSRLIENQMGVFEVALCDLTYSPLWYNISELSCTITAYVFRMSLSLYLMATITSVTWTQKYSSLMEPL